VTGSLGATVPLAVAVPGVQGSAVPAGWYMSDPVAVTGPVGTQVSPSFGAVKSAAPLQSELPNHTSVSPVHCALLARPQVHAEQLRPSANDE
jgi:hypothetical protein